MRSPHLTLALSALLALAAAAQTPAPPPIAPPVAPPAPAIDPPRTADEALEVALFAAEPMLQQPIGCTVDSKGRLLVIESHTHFRPKDWPGPPHDQIVFLLDKDGDGRADSRQVFFDQTEFTMDIATAPDGAIYLATRNEILRLRDDDGDGKPETVDRKLVWLETEGRYPHNGISGLTFDAKGNLFFGMGENLGAPYTLTGSDGSSQSDEGEGGNIWRVTRDGARLQRIATGFWNPFGVCIDPWGNLFATDNDPDASPPCRLQHIVSGGDFGYQFRYGRTGLHPFVSWNGSRLGTLPMLAGTGEAPCDVMHYTGLPHPQYRGLPAHWAGTLLVASWVDHRVESYKITPARGTFDARRQVLLQGGADFRPVGFATAADGTLFVTDWVRRDYELHGKGRVWTVRAKTPTAIATALAQPHAEDEQTTLRRRIESGSAPTQEEALQWLGNDAPYIFSAAIERLSREPRLVRDLAEAILPSEALRAGVLLSARRGLVREGAAPSARPPDLMKTILDRSLRDTSPRVVLLALHWISDERLRHFRVPVQRLAQDHSLEPEIYYAALTTLARLDSANPSEADLVKQLKQVIADPASPPARVRMAVTMLPGIDRFSTPSEVYGWLTNAADDLAPWLTHVLGIMRDPARLPLLRDLALTADAPPAVRAAALLHAPLESAQIGAIFGSTRDIALRHAAMAAAIGQPAPPRMLRVSGAADSARLEPMANRLAGQPFQSKDRPRLDDIESWFRFLRGLPGEPDPDHGRLVFLSPKLGGCAACHRMEGIGSTAGPNLGRADRVTEKGYILESILQPNANIAPQFQSFSITTTDGQTRMAFQLNERGGTHTYIDLAGQIFEIKIEDIVRRDTLPISIMPEGIVSRLTDAEVRDLLAYLGGL